MTRVLQAIQAMKQEQANILGSLRSLRDTIEDSDLEEDDPKLTHTLPAVDTSQNPTLPHYPPEMEAHRQFMYPSTVDGQQYFAPSAFITLVKPIPMQAFAAQDH